MVGLSRVCLPRAARRLHSAILATSSGERLGGVSGLPRDPFARPWPALLTAGLALVGLVTRWRVRDPLVAPLILGSLLNVLILAGYGDNPDLPFLPRYFLNSYREK